MDPSQAPFLARPPGCEAGEQARAQDACEGEHDYEQDAPRRRRGADSEQPAAPCRQGGGGRLRVAGRQDSSGRATFFAEQRPEGTRGQQARRRLRPRAAHVRSSCDKQPLQSQLLEVSKLSCGEVQARRHGSGGELMRYIDSRGPFDHPSKIARQVPETCSEAAHRHPQCVLPDPSLPRNTDPARPRGCFLKRAQSAAQATRR